VHRPGPYCQTKAPPGQSSTLPRCRKIHSPAISWPYFCGRAPVSEEAQAGGQDDILLGRRVRATWCAAARGRLESSLAVSLRVTLAALGFAMSGLSCAVSKEEARAPNAPPAPSLTTEHPVGASPFQPFPLRNCGLDTGYGASSSATQKETRFPDGGMTVSTTLVTQDECLFFWECFSRHGQPVEPTDGFVEISCEGTACRCQIEKAVEGSPTQVYSFEASQPCRGEHPEEALLGRCGG
jgi:hypothetical protein